MISSEIIMSGDGAALVAGLANLVTVLVSCGSGVVFYVLRSIGMYTIAKRRQINHAWFAWVPVLNQWLLGCVSDQYQYVVKGRNKSKRVSLLVLSILNDVCALVLLVFAVAAAFGAASGADVGVTLTVAVVNGLLCLGLSVALMVIRYIALYDLYSSCTPQNNVLFLVLSILIQMAEPIILFCIRGKDDGMPPRRVDPPVEEV